MSNLLATLGSSSGALRAFDQVLQVTQNNVANASTPGYAKQSVTLEALPFDLAAGATGGVRAGTVQSARDQYAEQQVRQQNTLLGQAQQNVASLTSLQSLFDISGQSGIPKALNDLLSSFSAWAQSPNDATARQTVINQATSLAGTFQQTAAGLNQAEQDASQQLQSTATQVNQLTQRLQGYNVQTLRGTADEPALDAQVNSTLEELSQYADFTAIKQDDGSVTVLVNGQTPLLVGDRQYPIGVQLKQPADATYPNRLTAEVMASDGTDITAATTGGQLGALVNLRNTTLPSYLGSASQPGDLNTMAKQFAQAVNQILTPVDNSSGEPVSTGVPLFTFDTTNDVNVAQTLAVNPAATADSLTDIDPGPPVVSNGVPLALAALDNPTGAWQINGGSYSQFFAGMASRVGNALNDATSQQQLQESSVAQAKNLRQQVSGVSLDEEATILIQFQRAYDANSRLITVLDQVTQDAINIIQ